MLRRPEPQGSRSMFCENVQGNQEGPRGCPALSGTRVRSSSGIRWTGIDAPGLLIHRIQRPRTIAMMTQRTRDRAQLGSRTDTHLHRIVVRLV